jgi:hypothetical protein
MFSVHRNIRSFILLAAAFLLLQGPAYARDVQAGLPSKGSLTVTISPAAAVSAGAKWNVDGGLWHVSGAKVELPAGNHTVAFRHLGAWFAPPKQKVAITSGNPTPINSTYVPGAFLLPASLGTAHRCSQFSDDLSTLPSGGTGTPFTFKTMGGSPPSGISIDSDGLVHGIAASAPGVYSFNVCVDDSASNELCKPSSIKVAAPVHPGTPSGPQPTNGATKVSPTTTLSWDPIVNADSYDFYGGATFPLPKRASGLVKPGFIPPGPLNGKTTYYWQVVAKHTTSCGNLTTATSGPVWTFTTGKAKGMNITGTLGTGYTTASGQSGSLPARVKYGVQTSNQTVDNILAIQSDRGYLAAYSMQNSVSAPI